MGTPNEALAWRKAVRCNSGGCVEVATDADAVYVRDANGSVLRLSRTAWAGLLAEVKADRLDFGP
jgi:hypothetical protein